MASFPKYKFCTNCGKAELITEHHSNLDKELFYDRDEWCRECRKTVNDRNNPYHNKLRSFARQLSGLTTRAFREMSPTLRGKWVDVARQLTEMGSSVDRAVVNEKSRVDGVIYVISHPRMDGVKIGKAFNAESRLRTFQTGCPHREYHLEFQSIYFEDAVSAERKVHGYFYDKRMQGEWFDVEADEAVAVLKMLKDSYIETIN